jgi:hypothetical protein
LVVNQSREKLALAFLAAAMVSGASAFGMVSPAVGGSERLLGTNGGTTRVSLERGPTAESVCYEATIRHGGDGDNSAYQLTLGTEPVTGDTVPGGVVMEFSFGVTGSVKSDCITGLDPAVVSDIFANPSTYHLVFTDYPVADIGCGIICSTTSSPFALEGSACVFPVGGVTSLIVRPNEPFELVGVAFAPGTVATLTFTPQPPALAGSADVTVDSLTVARATFVPREDQRGVWTVTATGSGGCQQVISLTVGAAVAGSTYPADGTPLPMSAGAIPDPIPAASPAPVLPNTAMPTGD